MYLLRSSSIQDLESLYELSSLMTFINLPNNRIELEELLNASDKSFKNPSEYKEDNVFIFVIENTLTKKVMGASVIHARHGTEQEPHYFLKVGQEQKFSQSLSTGFIHGTLKLGLDTQGYTEIGGLVLHPELRGNGEKLGKQISFTRFLYMANNLNLFCEKTHSELMPPFDHEGKSPLWEAIGRRFLNMDYYEADKLSRKNPEFILSLFPASNIYQTLLPVDAREAIGKVGRSTKPVQRMLESIGFVYTNEVDPFDGGPHYRCPTDRIKPINEMKSHKIKVVSDNEFDANQASARLLSIPSEHSFCAVKVEGYLKDSELVLPESQIEQMKLKTNEVLSSIPI